jgi:hypothetical protein
MIVMIDKLLRLITNINLKYLRGICFTILVIILIAGLWPFNFFPENKVSWLKDKNGVNFSGQGMILSPYPLNDPQQLLLNKQSITIEIMIHQTEESKNGIDSILSIYDGKGYEVTSLGQWKNDFIIRSRNKNTFGNISYSKVDVNPILGKDKDYLLSIKSGSGGTIIYINGQLVRTSHHHHLLGSMTSKNIGFILGNSTAGKSSWKGNIMWLAIYNRTFSAEQIVKHYQSYLENNFNMHTEKEGCIGLYLFNEKQGASVKDYSNLNNHLTIPVLFRPVKKIILELPWQDFRWNWSFVQDTIVNLLGFIPLGFFFTAFLLKASNWKKKIIYISMAATGFAISLAIELSQIYLPSRYSELDDVICNSVGTVLGILILHLIIQSKKIHLDP